MTIPGPSNQRPGAELSRLASLAAVLRLKKFRRLLVANSGWYAARWIDTVATGWLILELTHSPVYLATIASLRTLPMLLFGVFGGMIADRFPRRMVLVAGLSINAIVAGYLAMATITRFIEPWHLIVTSLIFSTTWALNFPSQRLFIGETVDRRSFLTTGLATDQFVFVGSNVIFSAIAGVSIPIAGVGAAYFLAFLCFLAGILAAFAIGRPVGPGVYDADDQPSNLRDVIRLPVVAGVLAVSVCMNGLVLSIIQLFPLAVKDVLEVGPAELGFLTSAWGAGSLLGSVSIFLSAPRNSGLLFLVGSLGTSVAMLVFTFSSVYSLSVLLIFLCGILVALFGTFQSSLIIESAGSGRAKAMGSLAVAIGVQPIGVLATGAIASLTDPATALRISATLGVVSVAAAGIYFSQMRHHRSQSAFSESAD